MQMTTTDAMIRQAEAGEMTLSRLALSCHMNGKIHGFTEVEQRLREAMESGVDGDKICAALLRALQGEIAQWMASLGAPVTVDA